MTPAGIAAGKPTDVTLHGGNLNAPSGLWTSFPATVELTPGVEKNGEDPAKVVYRITPAAEVPIGVAAIRYATKSGVSNLRLLLIDDLPTVDDNGQNKSPETAQELTLPAAVDGAVEAESYDYYKFTGKAGQRVSVEVYAKRLGTALDPTIRLLDTAGKELAYSDDEGGIGADSRFSLLLPADGVYTIELRDITYAGGGAHRYRMRVGDFPLVATAFPLAIQKGQAAELTAAGPAVENVAKVSVTMPADAVRAAGSAAKFTGGAQAAPLPVIASDLPEFVCTGPVVDPPFATLATLPCGLNGRFEQPGDNDYFRFDAKAGQRFIFQGQTRSAGSPAALFLRIYDGQGKVLVEADDPIVSETRLDFTAPADGGYFLRASEALRFHGPQYTYRVEVRPYEPGFSLSLDAEQLNVPQGGVFVAKVVVARRDYAGPITLEIKNAGEGWQIAGNTIPENAAETTLSVTVPAGMEPGKLLEIGVVGKAKIGDKDVAVEATTGPALAKVFPGLTVPPPRLVGSLGLGVGPPFPEFFQLAAPEKVAEFPQVIAAGNLKITATRLNNFPDAINLAVAGLPEGVTVATPMIAAGQGEVVLAFTGPAELPEGEHKLTITGSGTFQNQPKSFVVSDVVLKVVKPLDVSVAAAGEIQPGGKQKLKVTLVRRGGEKPEVVIELKNLPAGVTGPAEIKIGPEQSEIEVELSAAADAAAVKMENVQAVAKCKIKDKDVVVESPPGVVEVKPAA